MKTVKNPIMRWIFFSVLIFALGTFGFMQGKGNPWFSFAVAGLISLLLIGVEKILSKPTVQPTSAMESKTENFHEVDNSQKSLEVTIRSLKKILETHTEKELLDVVLQSGIEMIGAEGASFVPYDEWGQSLPATTLGKVPVPVLQSWAKSLSSPRTRQECKKCKTFHGSTNCILISQDVEQPKNVYCFPLKSADREVGVLNFYFSNADVIDLSAKKYFAELLDSSGQILENMHTRDQEIAALLYLQTVNSPKSDLTISLNSLLENVQHALDVDYAFLYLPGGIPGQINSAFRYFSKIKNESSVENYVPNMPFLEGIWKSVLGSGHSLSLENVTQDKHELWKTVLAVPLVWRGDEPVGVLVLASNSSQAFSQRHLALLETLAGQAALLIQNARLMVQVEYQAVVDERTRLAREIHDGLAQTLAFLKIQAAQMQNFLAHGETEKLTNTLQANYRTLSDAYIDARQAIEDLRRVPTSNFKDWISQIALDYEQATGQTVEVNVENFSVEYPANIQAQLIRIVQEALSNVRKHAAARQISIVGHQDGDFYLIKLCDDGRGFTPSTRNAEGSPRYGLRGMRERSESIGADFQITSQPGMGTCVSVCVPMLLPEEL